MVVFEIRTAWYSYTEHLRTDEGQILVTLNTQNHVRRRYPKFEALQANR